MEIKKEIKDRIVKAAQELVSEGVNEPTNEAIRKRLGGGSLSHISPVMREFRSGRKDQVAAAVVMPGELKAAIESNLAQVWSVATKIANASVEVLKVDSDKKVSVANIERDEALEEIFRLESGHSTLLSQLDSAGIEIKKLSQVVIDLQTSNNKNSTDIAVSRAKLDAKEEQVVLLKSELSRSQEEVKTLQKVANKMELMAEKLSSTENDLSDAIAKAGQRKEESVVLAHEVKTLNRALTENSDFVETSRKAVTELTTALAIAEEKLLAKDAGLELVTKESSWLKNKVDSLQAELVKFAGENAKEVAVETPKKRGRAQPKPNS